MKKYETTGVINLFGGVVGLSKAQAASRSHALKKLKSGRFEVVAPVQFKAGEIIGLEKPDKATLLLLESCDPKECKEPQGHFDSNSKWHPSAKNKKET